MQLLLYMFNIDSEPVILYCFVLSSALFCHKTPSMKKERENCENFFCERVFAFGFNCNFSFALPYYPYCMTNVKLEIWSANNCFALR